jgi:hypothetical protein
VRGQLVEVSLLLAATVVIHAGIVVAPAPAPAAAARIARRGAVSLRPR